MPNANTLSIAPIAEFAARYLVGHSVILDPFSKDNLLGTHRNDLDPDTKAQYHMEAEYFLAEMKTLGVRATAAIVDPPYSPRQMVECYNKVGMAKGTRGSQNAALYRRTRDALMGVLSENAVVLSFGWNSAGMGLKRGFEIIEIMLVCHGAAHNDTICVAERRVPNLFTNP